jgi:hypothetical protein
MKWWLPFYRLSGDAELLVDFLKHCSDPRSAEREAQSLTSRLKSHGGSTLGRFRGR